VHGYFLESYHQKKWKISRETALHKACRSNRKDTCIWLLERGIDPTLLSSDGSRASEVTVDDDIKYICDHFSEFYEKWKETKRLIKENQKKAADKKIED
jgi:hypothetical protein